MEISFGFGMILGPPLGSLIYGLSNYATTFYFFAALIFISMILCYVFIPNRLNKNEGENNESKLEFKSDQITNNSDDQYNLMNSN